MGHAIVVGAGPAGLMAADALASNGHSVTVLEAKPSPARKFLMAGKTGLNLTKVEDPHHFLAAFAEAAPYLGPMLDAFGPREVMTWAETLNQDVFVGSTGRVFPKAMKASPLLRAWMARLERLGVVLHREWRWTGWADGGLTFDAQQGQQILPCDAAVLACGGASWARLGSDGAWVSQFDAKDLEPFQPSNMGFEVDWSPHMQRHFGTPVKGVALYAGTKVSRGEFVLSERGIEGGGLYEVSRDLREGAELHIDLTPQHSIEALRIRLEKSRGKNSLSNHLRKTLRLGPEKFALLKEFGTPLPQDLAPVIKRLPIPLTGSRPLDEAISVAGGLRFEALDETLMMRTRPGVFAAGEMLNWEAPTGGYLINASLATGLWAGCYASRWIEAHDA